ncbi:MAG: ribonuclease P protein component [Chloroflexi bacterium]|nr:ribonuclease P protein component [Chloroflexota bacterium]
MLQSQYRLRRPADIQRVRQQGHSWRHPRVVLLVQANALDASRFAFIASKRVGNAVKRNRAKRLMREVVRLHYPQISAGWDCLLIARPGMPEVKFWEVETAVLQCLKRANLLKTPEVTDKNGE